MEKKEVLLNNGTYNKNHSLVRNEKFLVNPFFDAMDIVQVKYEMLKEASSSQRTIEQTAKEFGFSRASFYKIKAAYEENGIFALVPDKSGPQKARKLSTPYQLYIDQYMESKPKASSSEIRNKLKEEKNLDISKRTIERYRSRSKHG